MIQISFPLPEENNQIFYDLGVIFSLCWLGGKTFFFPLRRKILFHVSFVRLERGGGKHSLSCACFLINLPFLNISRHTIRQIKTKYASNVVELIRITHENYERNTIITFTFRTQISY